MKYEIIDWKSVNLRWMLEKLSLWDDSESGKRFNQIFNLHQFSAWKFIINASIMHNITGVRDWSLVLQFISDSFSKNACLMHIHRFISKGRHLRIIFPFRIYRRIVFVLLLCATYIFKRYNSLLYSHLMVFVSLICMQRLDSDSSRVSTQID